MKFEFFFLNSQDVSKTRNETRNEMVKGNLIKNNNISVHAHFANTEGSIFRRSTMY